MSSLPIFVNLRLSFRWKLTSMHSTAWHFCLPYFVSVWWFFRTGSSL